MHELFKEKFKMLDLSFSKVEESIGCPKNYLSRFINGPNDLPRKWEEKINEYLGSLEPQMAGEMSVVAPKTKLVVDKNSIKEVPSDESWKKVKETMDAVNKKFGPGTVMMGNDRSKQAYKTISTGSIGLDAALRIGGLPRGRIVEIYGLESTGKSTIALHAIADAQKQGLKCLLVDAEYSYDPEYAASLGVDIDKLQVCFPNFGEEGLQAADEHIVSGAAQVVVIDSVAALIPKGELEGDMGDSKMGLHARLMSQACRKMTASVAKTGSLLIFINQIRNKIGIVYGSPEVTTGGMALQFYASIRLDVRRATVIKDGDVQVGNRVRVKVTKNKCAPPFGIAEFDILYGQGINRVGELVDIAVEKGIFIRSGSWYSHGDQKLGQGRDAVIEFLNDNEAFIRQLEKLV